jgi:hypothetical protein
MNKLFFLFTLVFVSVLSAKEIAAPESDYKLNLYLPGLQFRYEDNSDQSRAMKNGYSLRGAIEFKNSYLLGLEYNLNSEKSGNSSLSIARDFSEVNAVMGYQFLEYSILKKRSFGLYGMGYLGQNKSKIKTELLGNTTIDESAAELTYGAGVLAALKLNYFLIEFETRMLVSKSYEPQTISVSDLRLGFQIEL